MTASGTTACVAVLRRSIGASLERVWENVLDWEHLPWLHDSSFAGIECLEAGGWGWRARAQLPGPGDRSAVYELVVDRAARRYVSRTLEGSGAGTEIWTTLDPREDHRTDIEVRFCVPELAAASEPADETQRRRDRIGSIYLALYERLWDEDEQMMIERELRLARARQPSSRGGRLALGSEASVREKVPFVVELDGHPYRIVEREDRLHAHSALCPHRLGPLVEDCAGEPSQVRCPWHGYRFDLHTGRSCDGVAMWLSRAPELSVLPDGEVVLCRSV